MESFRAIADRLAEDIAAGRLRPGERLLPSREFAYRHRIAPSTAGRVYAELVRRGLASGEVGRGTFVRAAAAPAAPRHTPPGLIDLEMNFALLPEEPPIIAEAILRATQNNSFPAALRQSPRRAGAAAHEAAAAFLAQPEEWRPDPATLLFAGNGRQGIAAALASLAAPGERIGFEAMTYPVVKGIAHRLGLHAVPLAMDEEGVRPDAIEHAHRAAPLRALYLQPSLHNPLGVTMPPARRAAIAQTLQSLGVTAVEDVVYAFLLDPCPKPLSAYAPDRVITVDSLSKRVAPGLTAGMLVCPPALTDRVAVALRTGAWGAQGFCIACAAQAMQDGTAARLAAAKRRDAAERAALARERLAGLSLIADPRAYHAWLELPGTWRADTFVAAAARRGVAVTPAASFAAASGHAPNAVRLALAAPPREDLAPALDTLAALAAEDPSASLIE